MRVIFEGCELPAKRGELLLDILLRADLPVPFGCRSGVCHSCMLRVESGDVPVGAQQGLTISQAATGHVLACRCEIGSDLVLSRPGYSTRRFTSVLQESRELVPGVFRLRASVPAGFAYEAGQYVTLWRDAQVCRAYSIASTCEEPFLEFHVRLLEGGQASSWLAALAPGASLELRGPIGSCVYHPAFVDAPLLLAANGVGLAPLWGVLRTALAAGHRGAIHLVHGVREPARAYLHGELLALQAAHANVQYERVLNSELVTAALARSVSFSGWKVYLCGSPEIVTPLRKRIFLSGAASGDIFVDAFVSQAGGQAGEKQCISPA